MAEQPESKNSTEEKIFYTISEVGKITNVPPYVLRYWEKEFKQLAPEKGSTRQRRYRRTDIEIVQEIRKLLYDENYTIEGARKKLKDRIKESRQLSFDMKGNDLDNLLMIMRTQLQKILEILKQARQP